MPGRKLAVHRIPGFVDPLTDKALELLELVASGRKRATIASRVGYSDAGMGRYIAFTLYENLLPEEYEVDPRVQCTKLYWRWRGEQGG